MSNKQTTGMYMRIVHRYLGFFLAGIMAVYALSGIVMVFRNTDFLKQDKQHEKTIEADVIAADLSKAMGMKKLKVTKEEGSVIYFNNGSYDKSTGVAQYTTKELPFILGKMTHFHKATTNDPLYWLNIFFGFALLFFVISAFWMFRPATSVFKKGLYFTLGGIILTLILLFV